MNRNGPEISSVDPEALSATAGTPGDETLPPLVRRALDANWSNGVGERGPASAWEGERMLEAFRTRWLSDEDNGRAPREPRGVAERGAKMWGRRDALGRESLLKEAGLVPRLTRYGSLALLGIALFGVWLVQSRHSRGRAQPLIYRTAPGQQSTVKLADGSTMRLAPATSVVSTAQGFDITGEAYFIVAPHLARPFLVRTQNASVQVLGTRFLVRQYRGETKSRIVVEDGKVSVGERNGSGPRNTSIVLGAHMLAQVLDSGVVVFDHITTQEYTSWTRGTLVFRGVVLRDVAVELARAYNVEITIADSALAAHPMRMEVSIVDDAIDKVLDAICRVSDAHYIRRGRTFVLILGPTANRTIPSLPQHQHFPQPERQYGR